VATVALATNPQTSQRQHTVGGGGQHRGRWVGQQVLAPFGEMLWERMLEVLTCRGRKASLFLTRRKTGLRGQPHKIMSLTVPPVERTNYLLWDKTLRFGSKWGYKGRFKRMREVRIV